MTSWASTRMSLPCSSASRTTAVAKTVSTLIVPSKYMDTILVPPCVKNNIRYSLTYFYEYRMTLVKGSGRYGQSIRKSSNHRRPLPCSLKISPDEPAACVQPGSSCPPRVEQGEGCRMECGRAWTAVWTRARNYSLFAKYMLTSKNREFNLFIPQKGGIMSKWDMYCERSFIENLLCQRFNFFVLSFSLIMTSAFSVKSIILFRITICSGIIICVLLWVTIYRIYTKLDTILKLIYKYDENSIFHIIQERVKSDYPFSFHNMNRIIGIVIPLICIFVLIIVLCVGWNSYPQL